MEHQQPTAEPTKKTAKERGKYNEMVKEGTASYKQLREQSTRVRDAHIAERRAIDAVNSSLADTIQSRREHDVVVKANVASLRDLSRATLNQQRSAEDLHRAHLDTIRDSAALTRSFDQVSVTTERAFREHQKYNQMARDGSVKDIKLIKPSGNWSFDLSAQGAVEAAGTAGAFGPLPDGWPADVLPVSFYFTPRTQ